MLKRLNKIWEAIGDRVETEPAPTFHSETRNPKGMATIVPDEPLEIFPSETYDETETSERPLTNWAFSTRPIHC